MINATVRVFEEDQYIPGMQGYPLFKRDFTCPGFNERSAKRKATEVAREYGVMEVDEILDKADWVKESYKTFRKKCGSIPLTVQLEIVSYQADIL